MADLTHLSSAVGGENLSEDIDQLFELTRIIVLVLAGLLPNLTDAKAKGSFYRNIKVDKVNTNDLHVTARHQLSDEAVSLVCVSLEALVDAAEVFPSVIKTDLHACIIHIFAS